MDDDMIKQLRKEDLQGDKLAARILEMMESFEDLERTARVRLWEI